MKEILPLAIIILVFILSIPFSSSDESNDDGLSIDLIHRYTSPNYNSSMTQSDFLIEAAFRSIARAKRLFNASDDYLGDSKAVTDLIPNTADYLMKIFIGTPGVETLVSVDTGSSLSWIQCLPCPGCFKQKAPFFNPKKSSTYKRLGCYSKECNLVYTHACGDEEECRYFQKYKDGSFSSGTLATDTISFNNKYQGRIRKYPNVILGCGHTQAGKFSYNEQGIIGLDRGPLSLFTQIKYRFYKQKFSYCMIPRYLGEGITGKIKFGLDTQKNRKDVVTTLLVTNPPFYEKKFYEIVLTGVSINGKLVNARKYNDGAMVVDSGTTLTLLQSGLFEEVAGVITSEIGARPDIAPPQPFRLCYGNGAIKKFPTISLGFLGAKNQLRLYPFSVFTHIRKNVVCLLILPTEGVSILGNLVQENHNVEYDLDEVKVSFAPTDCLKEK